jgi:rRNA maturation endonuclease Nob1
MGVRDALQALADGGTRRTVDGPVHYECRHCSRNLTADDKECPDCGGTVAIYELE